ncbi:MAG: A24 family peptidase C-terminal domain-containing protein, partial [Candidatus Thermoplasmatota archaeon]
KEARWEFFLMFIPIGVLFAEAFVDRPPIYSEGKINFRALGWIILPILVFVFLVNRLGGVLLFWSLTMILAVMLFTFALYFFYIIHGGADAKAVITLAILFPFYPTIPELTHRALSAQLVPIMEILFPFTLVIVLNASLIVMVLPFTNLFINLSHGDIDFPKMLFGYKKKVSEIEDSFVWPMEYYEDGEVKTELLPRSVSDERIESLKKHGREEVWTTPKLPFIIPILIGLILSVLIGNPIMYIM